MDLEKLYTIIFNVYTDCEVTKLPIDCFDIVHKCGYRIKKYSELTQKKKGACMDLSPDSCLVEDTLYYQDQNCQDRVRFSLMHELGHVFLNTGIEETADIFASHMLAPRILIHKFRCRNADQIHDTFGISYTAANRALTDYKDWYSTISRTTRKPSAPELQLESIFFSEEKKLIEVERQHNENNEKAQRLDPEEKYLLVYQLLQAGLPIPAEYQRALQFYRKMGFRLK